MRHCVFGIQSDHPMFNYHIANLKYAKVDLSSGFFIILILNLYVLKGYKLKQILLS